MKIQDKWSIRHYHCFLLLPRTRVGITIFTNPFEDMEKQEAAAEEADRKKREAEAAGSSAGKFDEDYKVWALES